MPTPDRTSLDAIVHAGRDILEAAGVAGLTMQAVADRVGVRAPSLYKRVRNRDDLVRLITEATVRDLGERLAAIGAGTDPRRELAELARAFRAFAHDRPRGYQLIFAPRSDLAGPSIETLTAAVEPVLRVTTNLAGEHHALDAARTLTAWANGFVSMELAGAFTLGGDVDQAYEFGIARLADALAR
ncbi:TetR-like C-terminal domain-containing protein [Micromonospora sp. NPDC049101]|uniref:TetR-like C-terminal domain-containing protein n=1 Tax=unclassified Micromonospora TaxID=2617518 RepID=UPI0033FEF036